MTASLRAVGYGDLERLARLHAHCFPDEAWDAAALGAILKMPGADGRLAEEWAQPIGLIFAVILGEETEILTLGVAPAARRRGIARLMLDDLFARARAVAARRVVLEVAADNSAALALYETAGFRTVGLRHGYYQRSVGPAIDAWLLRLAL